MMVRRPQLSPKAVRPDPIPEVLRAVTGTVDMTTRELHEEIKWNNAWRAGEDLVLCYAAFDRHVGIEFWRGATLDDPEELLEGTGKNLRHVKVRSIAEARAPKLLRLIRAAVALDRTSSRRTR
jgi:hypothetical protein